MSLLVEVCANNSMKMKAYLVDAPRTQNIDPRTTTLKVRVGREGSSVVGTAWRKRREREDRRAVVSSSRSEPPAFPSLYD